MQIMSVFDLIRVLHAAKVDHEWRRMEIELQPRGRVARHWRVGQGGFTRTEWLIVVVVLGILGATIYPAYLNYTIRPKFGELPVILLPYKAAIETCVKNGSCVVDGALTGLGVGKLGVPPSISTTHMARVTVSPNGVITATASNAGGLAGETFVLTPTLSRNGQLTWAIGGTCKTRELGAIC